MTLGDRVERRSFPTTPSLFLDCNFLTPAPGIVLSALLSLHPIFTASRQLRERLSSAHPSQICRIYRTRRSVESTGFCEPMRKEEIKRGKRGLNALCREQSKR